MKIREGFISNSSSSSFIIGSKEELTVEMLMRIFDIGQNSPLYHIAKAAAKFFQNVPSYTKEEYIEDRGYTDDSELTPQEKKIFDRGFYFYSGYARDDGYGADGIEAAICSMDLNYEDDDIIIYKESGY